jgi:hypothetical protein
LTSDRLSEYRQRLLSAVDEHLEKGEKATAVVQVQKRAVWALPLGIGAALLLSLFVASESALYRGAVIGLAIAVVLISGTNFYALASNNRGELVLADTAKMSQAKVKGVAGRFPLDDTVTTKNGFLTDKVTIGGKNYLVNRQFRSQLGEVLDRS